MVVCVGTRRGESGTGSCLLRWLLPRGHGGVQEKVGAQGEQQRSVPWERLSAHCEQRGWVTGSSQMLLQSAPELQGWSPRQCPGAGGVCFGLHGRPEANSHKDSCGIVLVPVTIQTNKTNVLYDREDIGLYLGNLRISHLCGLHGPIKWGSRALS